MKSYFIGFDVGSHSSKGVLIEENGTPIASKSLEHETLLPASGWQEQNPEIWWQEFQQITTWLLEKSAVDPSYIKSVGITGFVPGLVILNKEGQPARPSIMHTDIRAVDQLNSINKILSVKITHGFLMPKLIWIKDNEEEIFESIFKILVPHSFIVKKLTGKYSCDRDTATIFGGVYDEILGEWSKEICATLGLNSNIFPKLYNVDSVVGTIDANSSGLTGLAEGTPVIAGTGDTFAALLGCGAVLTGDMMIYLGTSGTQLYIDGDLDNFTNGPHFGLDKAVFTGRIISAGDSMQHYRDILGFKDWEKLNKEALGVNPGSDGLFVFPHLKQKTDNEKVKGDMETVFGLDTNHSPWHIYRAVLEGIASNLKASFVNYESRVKRLILAGGGAKSRVFREIIGAVLNKNIYYNPQEDGAVGVALLAGHTITGDSLKKISALISAKSEIAKPDPNSVDIYKEHYKKYTKLRIAIEELYKELEIENNE